jgi:hypothetical protein
MPDNTAAWLHNETLKKDSSFHKFFKLFLSLEDL